MCPVEQVVQSLLARSSKECLHSGDCPRSATLQLFVCNNVANPHRADVVHQVGTQRPKVRRLQREVLRLIT